MKNIILYSALVALVLSSCEKEIKLKESKIEPRIVVNSIFSAGNTVRIHLSESRNILYEGELPNITSATAKFLDVNGSSLGQFIHEGEGNYYLPNAIYPVAGNSYSFSASYSGFTSVTATSTTPSIIEMIKIDTTSISGGTSFSDKMEFAVSFQDNANQANYYSIAIYSKNQYEVAPGVFEEYYDYWFNTSEIIIDNGNSSVDDESGGNEFYFSDDSFNGQTFIFDASKYYDGSSGETTFYIELRSLSEDYYKYKLSYAKHLDAQDNPFGEPVQVHSNIENGFGIFGGYSLDIDSIKKP